MLKLSISFTSQETEGSVSVLKAIFFFFWQLQHWELALSASSSPQAVLKAWCVPRRDK